MSFVSKRELRFKRQRRSQGGQALVEYILVMIVVVAIVLGGMYQLSSAFQVWANAYFGEYLTCLLETGELPTLGSSETTGECAQSYKEFSIADGRPFVGRPVQDQAGGPIPAPVDPNRIPTENTRGEANADSPTSAGVAAGGGGGGPTRFRAARAPRSGAGGGGPEGGVSRENRDGGGAVGQIGSGQDGRPTRIALEGSYAGGARRRLAEEGESESRVKTSQVEQGQGQKSGPQLIPIQRGLAQSEDAPEIEGWTFGNFLRFLIIAAIILALLVFFGGQLLQASKSME